MSEEKVITGSLLGYVLMIVREPDGTRREATLEEKEAYFAQLAREKAAK